MLVLHLNNSPLIAGLVAFAAIAPSILFYIPAGALVDRWNPRRAMLFSECLRGVAIASVVLALAMFGPNTSIFFLIAAMIAEEILEVVSILADRRYLSRLIERDKIASSQAYIEVRVHAAVLAGRPVGSWLFYVKPLLPFLADALSFCFSVGSLLLLRGHNEPARKWEPISARQLYGEVGQGFKWLARNRHARMTIAFMAVTSLIAQALIMMFLAEAHAKELSTLGIGVVLAASGAGGALGSAAVRLIPAALKRRWSAMRRHWLEFQFGSWSLAIGLLAMAGGLPAWWSAGAMFILGFTGAIGNIAFGTYLVANVADNMLARVTSIGQVLTIAACALGPVIGGAAIQFRGPKGAVWVLFLAVAAAALVVVELNQGIMRRILRAGRQSFASAAMSALAPLHDHLALAPVRLVRQLAELLRREMRQWMRIISVRLGRSAKIVDHDRQFTRR
jgi:MFS family permease